MITSNVPALKINKFKSKKQYEEAVAAGVIDDSALNFILSSNSAVGLLPQVTVFAPSGGTVTAKQNSSSMTKTAVDYKATFDIPSYGEWEFSCTTSDGTTSTDTLKVEAAMQYSMNLIIFNETFADNSWAEIIIACQTDSVPSTWLVGDSKTMTVNGTSYQIDIIGKHHDSYSDGKGTAPITFQFHDCYSQGFSMYTESGTLADWSTSLIRTTHLPTIKALMPTEVQSSIRKVNKLTYHRIDSSTTEITTTEEELFLLAAREFLASASYASSSEGTQYEYYTSGNSCVKVWSDGSATSATRNYHWTRSPSIVSTTYYNRIDSTGKAIQSIGTFVNGIAPAFCF